jgi:hypothetical protein
MTVKVHKIDFSGRSLSGEGDSRRKTTEHIGKAFHHQIAESVDHAPMILYFSPKSFSKLYTAQRDVVESGFQDKFIA